MIQLSPGLTNVYLHYSNSVQIFKGLNERGILITACKCNKDFAIISFGGSLKCPSKFHFTVLCENLLDFSKIHLNVGKSVYMCTLFAG